MKVHSEDIAIVSPLFSGQYNEDKIISARDLSFSRMGVNRAVQLNELWHSRLPILTNYHSCRVYGAIYGNRFYAVALWGPPIARALNGLGYYELRRMAISNESPKFTASRMIGWMLRELKKEKQYEMAISYQDTEVHLGTIYKATGWVPAFKTKWVSWRNSSRLRNPDQTTADKIRWEFDLRKKKHKNRFDCPGVV